MTSPDYAWHLLLVEGVASIDGRIIEPGATQWGDRSLPVLRDDVTIGYIWAIARHGAHVWGSVTLGGMDSEPGALALTVDTSDVHVTYGEDGDAHFHALTIIGAHLSREVLFPWPEHLATATPPRDHCWHGMGHVLASNPIQLPEQCCNCGHTRRRQPRIVEDLGHGPHVGTVRRQDGWTYRDGALPVPEFCTPVAR